MNLIKWVLDVSSLYLSIFFFHLCAPVLSAKFNIDSMRKMEHPRVLRALISYISAPDLGLTCMRVCLFVLFFCCFFFFFVVFFFC